MRSDPRPCDLATDVLLSSCTTVGSNLVTWQGSGASCHVVPVRRSTWGQVKALYR